MGQTSAVLATLKQILRERSLSYSDLARAIGVSESTIKRTFSLQQMSLERLETICHACGISLLDLMQRVRLEERSDIYQLTLHQERVLIRDIKLFYFFWMLISGHELRLLMRRFKLDRDQVQRYLVKLDTLELIELHDDNRFTRRVSRQVRWNPHGPIEKTLVARAMPRFLSRNFDEGELLRFMVVKLSPESRLLFRRKLDELVEEMFRQAVELDAFAADAKTTGVVVAIGDLDFSLRSFTQG